MNAFAEKIAALRSADHPRLRAIGSRVSQFANRLRQTWSRSLQLRVGVTTATVTSVVVILVGVFLVNQISAGILRAKRDAAIAQANTGLQTAQRVLSGVGVGDVAGVSAAVDQIQANLTATGPSAGLFTIEIESTSAPLSTAQSETGIPIELRRLVQGGNLAVQYSPISQAGHRDPVPGLIVGEPISAAGGVFELYYLFALTAEQSTISLVQRTVLISGIVLVIFISGIAYLVTRQVVRPVQVAAATAARLAAGDLSQRIPVHGTDDIALLGQSFNDMAGSLQGQIRRLEDLSRLQQRFTSDVSHELRTPLTTIRMATELLYSERAEFAPVLARSVELLLTELDRFEALLADLLEISRYDAGVARLDSEKTDLRGVLANAVAASNTLAQRHGIELVVDGPATPVLVEMDARRVERILRNLIGNALDHADGRPVVATVAADEHSAAVAVRDHGVGLRPGEAGLVFNRFWRGDPSRSRLTGGTGLGLAISLEDARLHGGWLQAWGERGLGAQFRLTLPLNLGDTLVSSPLPLEPEALIEFDVRQDG
ncbi:two-component system sensor histidine kinase MtrB [Jatrophihabitans sp. GAS493]|uniref:MtrAB system histidine kinase MtrB n=1 Tax=Jatrophihabitans sp. GAS493 TaxID=1907575 RepID=UPI000BB723AE|nr:MtrAB system histidine kinase MtrB [Jatrophihabitans sp. GAS493]SOD73102.1 two-component system sensor histidine kinase MtrB [Jatrophihabitans sp. GAS493]